ncbi:hypothetical protein NXX78_21230 [Bacteroides fragilis]|nr:hypothetical protein [Bacteroides fragilis]
MLLESCFYFDASVGEGLGRIISMISFSMPEWCMAYPFQYFSIRPLGAINIKQGMDFIPYALGSSFLCGVALGQKISCLNIGAAYFYQSDDSTYYFLRLP